MLTINPDADEKQERVVRLPPSVLKPEMFIILRSTGGSDYIVTMADKLLGSAAAACRGQQQDWKDRLRTLVLDSSLLEVSRKLLEAGSTSRAYETNVRNWISSRNIRPHSYEDFNAIMRIIGIPDKAEEYWRSMEHIARHHQRAGQQIRRLLLRKLRSMDLTNLRRLGRLDIALPDADAGTLTAFRVMAIEPITRLIPAGHLNHPFHYGGACAPRMLPSDIWRWVPESPGEREIFASLKNDEKINSWTILHSLDLANHARQVSGEADFRNYRAYARSSVPRSQSL